LPVLKRALPVPALVRLMWPSRVRPRRPERDPAVVRAAWWASRLQLRRFPDNCFERSLLTYRFLALTGADPRLVLGMRREVDGLVGHAWVTVDGRAVQDSSESVHRFAQLIEFGPGGRATGAGAHDVDAKLFYLA
jgi:hypothetical protein